MFEPNYCYIATSILFSKDFLMFQISIPVVGDTFCISHPSVAMWQY